MKWPLPGMWRIRSSSWMMVIFLNRVILIRYSNIQRKNGHGSFCPGSTTAVSYTHLRTHHCTAGDHLGRTGLYERFSGYFRTDLATVLHRHLLPYFQRYSDSGTWKIRKETGLFQIKGETDHENFRSRTFMPVSYTHLDVYKRQCVWCGR